MVGGTSPKIFVSHSSGDKELATAFVSALVLAGVPRERVFFSSARSSGIPTGAAFGTYLRDRLAEAGLVVQIITPRFLSSVYCLLEAGGAWALEKDLFPILVPPLTPESAKPFEATQLAAVDDPATYDELHAVLGRTIGISIPVAHWNPPLNEFVQRLPGLLGDVEEAVTRADESDEPTARRTVLTSHDPRTIWPVTKGERGVITRAAVRFDAGPALGMIDKQVRASFEAALDPAGVAAYLVDDVSRGDGAKSPAMWELDPDGSNTRSFAAYRVEVHRAFRPGLGGVGRAMLRLPHQWSSQVVVIIDVVRYLPAGERRDVDFVAGALTQVVRAALSDGIRECVSRLGPVELDAVELHVGAVAEDSYGNVAPGVLAEIVSFDAFGRHAGNPVTALAWARDARGWAAAPPDSRAVVVQMLTETALDNGYVDAEETVPHAV